MRTIHYGVGTEGNSLFSDTVDVVDMMFLGAFRDSEIEIKSDRNSKLVQLLRSMVQKNENRDELVNILIDANNSLLKNT